MSENDRRKEVLFGYAVRAGDISGNTKIHGLHSIMQKGLTTAKQFETLKELIMSSKGEPTHKFEDLRVEHDERLKKNLIELGLTDERSLILSAFIKPQAAESTFENPTEILEAIRRLPAGLRDGGWTLIYSSEIDEDSPDELRTKWSDTRALKLYADGTLIASFDFQYLVFLRDEMKPRIIPVALVEVVYQFVAFYSQFLQALQASENHKVFVTVSLRNMRKDGIPTELQPGTAAPNTWSEPRAATENDFSKVFEIRTLEPGAGAMEILETIYAFFTLPVNAIPFVSHEEGRDVIDISRFTGR